MGLPTGTILGILSDNLKIRKSVLPISNKSATGWAKGLKIKNGGEQVLYTGHMYQLMPSIIALSGQMAMLEDTPITKTMPLGRIANKFINLSFFMGLLAPSDVQVEVDGYLKNVANLLKKAGVDFGYLFNDELYSGALVYDQGLDPCFLEHAKIVEKMFKDNKVKRIITIDPHTTHMLSTVYPKVIEGFGIEVKSYLEVLAEADMEVLHPQSEEIALHDSCVNARYEDIVEAPRKLLEKAGYKIKEPSMSGKATHCCGGPIEALFPKEAHKIADARVAQLKEACPNVTTMCPICMVNIRKAGEGKLNKVTDIAAYLAKAYL
jgi:Fe-S oxidoreductase